MTPRQRRWPKSAFNLVVWLLLLTHGKPSGSAEPPGNLQLDKILQWDQKLVAPFVFAPNGKTAAGCSLDWVDDPSLPGALRLWTVKSGEKMLDLNIPGAKLVSIAFSRDGQRLYSGSHEGAVRIHDLRSSMTEVIPDAIGQAVVISPDGTQLAISAGQVVRMVDLASKKITATKNLEEALDIVPCPMAFSPNGKVIAIARQDRLRVNVYEIELCDPRNLNSVAIIRDNSASAVTTLSYSPNGSLMATGGNDGTVAVWDMIAMKQRRKVKVFTNSNSKEFAIVVFSPDGKLLGVGGAGLALLLKVDTLEVVDRIEGQGIFTLAFSPDGRLLLTNRSHISHRQETTLWKVGNL